MIVVTDVVYGSGGITYTFDDNSWAIAIPRLVDGRIVHEGLNTEQTDAVRAVFVDRVSLNHDPIINAMKTTWADYSNLNNDGVQHLADVWTVVPVDGEGPQSNSSYLSLDISKLWDTDNNSLFLQDLSVGDVVTVRFDLTVSPSINNSSLVVRLNFAGLFSINKRLPNMDEGAGIDYVVEEVMSFYVGSDFVKDNGATFEIKSSSNFDLISIGAFIHINRICGKARTT